MGYLAAGMAHDIRNPLNSISLFTQLMRQQQRPGSGRIPGQDHQRDGENRCHHPQAAGHVPAFAQRHTDVRIDRVIDTALEVFAPQNRNRKIRLERRYELTPPPIKADAAELSMFRKKRMISGLSLVSMDWIISFDFGGVKFDEFPPP